MERRQIATLFRETAQMLRLSGANRFKVGAYENAAKALMEFPGDLAEAVRTGRLRDLPGVGATIFSNVESVLKTGRLPIYDELRSTFPPGLAQCLQVPGLGAGKVRALHRALGIDSLDALERACREGRLELVRGFGSRSAEHILRGIGMLRAAAGLFLYPVARARAQALVTWIQASGLASEVSVAGGVRRLREIVRGVTLVASSRQGAELSRAFRSRPDVVEVLAEDPGATRVRFLDGLPAVLRVVAPEDFPAALLCFTGSPEHSEGLRALAEKRNRTLDAKGLFARSGGRVEAASEEDLYAALDLAYIEPELREGTGEIEAAAVRRLPVLVARDDLRGVIHVHTSASDGKDSLEAMVGAARAAGYGYVAITDHSKSAGYAGGLSEAGVREQRDEIRKMRRRFPEVRILQGTEADILADGTIDYGDAFLEELDLVVASVHSRFGLSAEEQTARLVKAVRNPRVSVLGHPTGRLLLSREPLAADMDAVIDAAAESGCALEVNGSPHRMDLDWRWVRRAVDRGVTLAVDPDAHSTRELDYVPFGVGMARKGWARAADVLNARNAEEAIAWLEARRGGPIPESRDRASG